MSNDDIIYAILLLLGIAFGHFYRKVDNKNENKKWIGTIFGLFIVFFVSGLASFHLFVIILTGYLIMQYSGR
jgi:chromate transport protein ChrA